VAAFRLVRGSGCSDATPKIILRWGPLRVPAPRPTPKSDALNGITLLTT
jgi:hypothetical protein